MSEKGVGDRHTTFATRYARLIKTHLTDCIVGAYMCPWTLAEFNDALTRIFAQDYALLAPAIEVFTPLIYAHKSGRSPDWGRTFLEQSASFIPADHRVQLILDALDFPASLEAVAASSIPGWGIQLFAKEGASVVVSGRSEVRGNQVVNEISCRVCCRTTCPMVLMGL